MRSEMKDRMRDFLREALGLEGEDMEAFSSVAEKSLRDSMAALAAGLSSGDAGKAEDAAHSLKGCLRNMGLDDLAKHALEMEGLAGAGDFGALRERMADLARELGIEEGPRE